MTCASASRSPGSATFAPRPLLGPRLHVSARGDGHDDRLVVDQRLGRDLTAIVGDDLRAPIAPVLVADRDQLVADHAHQHLARAPGSGAAS